jgi:hypothetical protein
VAESSLQLRRQSKDLAIAERITHGSAVAAPRAASVGLDMWGGSGLRYSARLVTAPDLPSPYPTLSAMSLHGLTGREWSEFWWGRVCVANC